MRPDALRPATAKAADTATTKLRTRLSKGEKRNRKRLAEIGAVYHAAPVPRTAADILADSGQPHRSAPVTVDKWLTASVIDDAATVISAVFDEADRRDPNHQITRIALVDGNNHQINRIHTEAAARGIDTTTHHHHHHHHRRLHPRARIPVENRLVLPRRGPTGITYTAKDVDTLPITRHEFHGEWNCRAPG